ALVHAGRLAVDVAAGDEAGAAEIGPGGELAGRVEIRMVELAAVVGDADHHLGAAEAVQQQPGGFATRVGPRVDVGVAEMTVQMPLTGIRSEERRGGNDV